MAASRQWQAVQTIEDALAILSRIADCQNVIRLHAWNEGSFDRIFEEADAQGKAIAHLREFMSSEWSDAVEVIRRGK